MYLSFGNIKWSSIYKACATQRRSIQHNRDLLEGIMVIVLCTLLYKCSRVFLVEMDASWTWWGKKVKIHFFKCNLKGLLERGNMQLNQSPLALQLAVDAASLYCRLVYVTGIQHCTRKEWEANGLWRHSMSSRLSLYFFMLFKNGALTITHARFISKWQAKTINAANIERDCQQKTLRCRAVSSP